MVFAKVLEKFESRSPLSVMVRAALENVFAADRLDRMFEATACHQENRELMFSSVVDIMGLVAAKIHPTVYAGYRAMSEQLHVTHKAVYDKLQGIESAVSRELLRETSARLAQIVRKMRGPGEPLLPGYRVKILDGNHLRRTQRRLHVLANKNAAPLPGHALVVLDPQLSLVTDLFPCEDAYTQERKLLPAVLETVERRDLWIADRNFCTLDFLFGLCAKSAKFAIRQHAAMPFEHVGRRRKIGRISTGTVYEQRARLVASDGSKIKIVRRVSMKLDQPTRDHDTELHILTNLPRRVSAQRVAELYRDRWTIETAFEEIALNLQGEIETFGYPRAALFAFSTALAVFNIYRLMVIALEVAHGEEAARRMSMYYICEECAHVYRGMMIAIPPDYWRERYAALTPSQMARELLRLARNASPSRYAKSKRGPKKKKRKQSKWRRPHVSTYRVLSGAGK